MKKWISKRKAYFLTGLISLLVMAGSLAVVFLLPFQGIILLPPLLIAAVAGYVAWVALTAGLMPNPRQALENSITLDLISLIFGLK